MNLQANQFANFLDGTLSDAELSRMMAAVADDPLALDALIDVIVMDDLLWQHVESARDVAHAEWLDSFLGDEGKVSTVPSLESSGMSRTGRPVRLSACGFGKRAPRQGFGILCAVSMVIGLVIAFTRPPENLAVDLPVVVGRFSRSVDARWVPNASRWTIDDPLLIGSMLEFDSGRVELQFDSGAVMTVVGPASLEIQSANLVELHSGTATTRIENGNPGEFRVATPATDVLDLGTEFGVRVDPNGETDVVVFEGLVDFTPKASPSSQSSRAQRLSIGEAARVQKSGIWERLVSIHSDAFPFGENIFPLPRRRPPVIGSVSDNRRAPDSPKFYRIYHAGLEEDARAYVDRPYQWNGVTSDGMPAFLRGADYIATFNDDKHNKRASSPEITVELLQAADLYIFYDVRMSVPEWLSRDFEETGTVIGLDEGDSPYLIEASLGTGAGISVDQICHVWHQHVKTPGEVVLGPIGRPRDPDDNFRRRTMMGIAAQPAAAQE